MTDNNRNRCFSVQVQSRDFHSFSKSESMTPSYIQPLILTMKHFLKSLEYPLINQRRMADNNRNYRMFRIHYHYRMADNTQMMYHTHLFQHHLPMTCTPLILDGLRIISIKRQVLKSSISNQSPFRSEYYFY